MVTLSTYLGQVTLVDLVTMVTRNYGKVVTMATVKPPIIIAHEKGLKCSTPTGAYSCSSVVSNAL